MQEIEVNIETEGIYMVKLFSNQSLKPAIITRYTGPTKYKNPRLRVEWFNGRYGTFEPKDLTVFAFNNLINKPATITNENPKFTAEEEDFLIENLIECIDYGDKDNANIAKSIISKLGL